MSSARVPGLLLILISCVSGFGQTKISLKNQSINYDVLRFHIEKIIDGRPLKTNIGVVQRGMNNAPRIADFEDSLENEMMSLIAPLKESDGPLLKIAMRIDQLKITEFTTVTREYATASLSIDFFLVLENELYFIARKSSHIRSHGLDVTHQHDNNIAAVTEKILQEFNSLNLENATIAEDPVHWNDVASFQPKELPPSDIFNGDYPDALYLSFTSFLENEPDITEGYKVEEGSQLSINWLDERLKPAEPVYAIAYKGQLYKYYDKGFRLIERRGNKLLFLGKLHTDPGKAARNYAIGGLAGMAATNSKVAMRYEINLNTGEITELGYIRK